MASTIIPEEAKKLNCSLKGKSIRLERSYRDQWLEVTFKRTVRVADNEDVSDLPPDLGTFHLYSTSKYAKNMPAELAAKGGVFFPMQEREAMWINFKSFGPFAIKVHTGGVNAVSGEPAISNMRTSMRRLERFHEGKSNQDYMIVPDQKWLDGIATEDGRVRQFVSVPTKSGYSVETQVTGRKDTGGIQFEVTPQQPVVPKMPSGNAEYAIFVKTLNGKSIHLVVQGTQSVKRLMEQIQDKEGIRVDYQRLIFCGIRLKEYNSLEDYGIRKDNTIHLVLRLKGGGIGPAPDEESTEMSIAAGGRIKQSICADFHDFDFWDVDSTVLFNVQIVNTEVLDHITKSASSKPKPPMTAQECAAKGIPFFKFSGPEHNALVSGDFGEVKSIVQLDRIKASKGSHCTKEKSHDVPIVLMDREGYHLAIEPVAGRRKVPGTAKYVKF